MVAAVLGYDGQDISSPEVLNIANGLLEALSSDCSVIIGHFLSSTTLLVEPIPPSVWNESDEEQEFGFPDDVWQDEPIDEALHPPNATCNRFTLEFIDPCLEAAFTAAQNAAMTTRDAIGYIFGFVFLAFILFFPHTNFNQPGAAKDVQIWRWAICHLPLLFILSKRLRPLYIRNREAMLAFTLITGLLWNYYIQHYMAFLSASNFTRIIFMRGYVWLFTLVLIFQIRFRLVLPLAVVLFAIDATLIPKICSLMFPDATLGVCIMSETVKVGCIALASPLLLIWYGEKRSRENFYRRVQYNQTNLGY